MKAKDIMTPDPTFCRPETLLLEVARLMCEEDCGAIPVVDSHGKPVGMVTDRDITCRVVARGRDTLQTPVSECMTEVPVRVGLEASVDECCQLLEEHQIRRLLVVDDDGVCCGVISQADVARSASEHQTAAVVREVSRQTSSAPQPYAR